MGWGGLKERSFLCENFFPEKAAPKGQFCRCRPGDLDESRTLWCANVLFDFFFLKEKETGWRKVMGNWAPRASGLLHWPRYLAAEAAAGRNSKNRRITQMHITDPVADMLTRIRNANSAKHDTVDVPASKMKKSIAQILLDEGYIKSFNVVDDGLQGMIRITLKYNAGKEKVITGLRRVSKPGLRVYVGADELPRVLRGLGIAIISTSKGVMTDKKARELHVGGEVLAFVW
jgi:small subunit ribosomal protein S8